jgi:hypothetical protein
MNNRERQWDNEFETESWQTPDYFWRVIMNTAETRKVQKKDINAELLEAMLAMGPNQEFGENLFIPSLTGCNISTVWDAGCASFTTCLGEQPLSHGYFAPDVVYNANGWWKCAEETYFHLSDKSGIDWGAPPDRPESTPWLAVIRFDGDLKCECEKCKPAPQHLLALPKWLPDVEDCMGWILTKWGFPKQWYEDQDL